jgi:hypothetical protein
VRRSRRTQSRSPRANGKSHRRPLRRQNLRALLTYQRPRRLNLLRRNRRSLKRNRRRLPLRRLRRRSWSPPRRHRVPSYRRRPAAWFRRRCDCASKIHTQVRRRPHPLDVRYWCARLPLRRLPHRKRRREISADRRRRVPVGRLRLAPRSVPLLRLRRALPSEGRVRCRRNQCGRPCRRARVCPRTGRPCSIGPAHSVPEPPLAARHPAFKCRRRLPPRPRRSHARSRWRKV